MELSTDRPFFVVKDVSFSSWNLKWKKERVQEGKKVKRKRRERKRDDKGRKER